MWHSFPGFHLRRRLGQGACGEVFEVVRETDDRPGSLKLLDAEAVNAFYLDYCYGPQGALAATAARGEWSPHVAEILAFEPAAGARPAYYVLPLWADLAADEETWEPRTLAAWLGRAERAIAWRWIGELAAGLAFLHRNGVVHCSVKPGNVFLGGAEAGEGGEAATGHAVLADWGQGWLGGVGALPLNDHVFFAPPEQLLHPGDIEDGKGQRWDVYAFGATAYTLLTGRFARGHRYAPHWRAPEEYGDVPEPFAFAEIAAQEPVLVWPEPATDDAERERRRIIETCLALDPARRFAEAGEVLAALAAVPEEDRPHEAHEADETDQPAPARESLRPIPEVVSEASPAEVETPAPIRAWLDGARRRWALPATAALAGVLGVTALVQYGILRSARHDLSVSRQETGTLATDRDRGFATRDTHLGELQTSLATAEDALRRVTARADALAQDTDRLFEAYLDAAAQLPADRERSRLLLAGYEHFSSFLDASAPRPDLAPARLRARVHLAKIKAALGSLDEAVEKFDDARRDLETFLTQDGATLPEAERAQWHLLHADTALAEARARFARGREAGPVVDALAQALAFLEIRTDQRGETPELQRRLAESRLWLAQAEWQRVEQPDADALDRLQPALDDLQLLLGDTRVSLPTDKLLLGRGLLLRGRLERRIGRIENALATQVEAARVLLECGDQPEALESLAQCYGETGEMLAANNEAPDAVRAYSEAIKLLSERLTLEPQRADLRFLLAGRYADLTHLLRDHGEAARGLDYQQSAVQLLHSLLVKDPGNAAYAAALARRQADLADLFFALGKKTEALTQAKTALVLLDKLNLSAPHDSTELADRVGIAASYGVVGHLNEESKQPAAAQACFSKALAHYEAAVAVAPGDESIGRGLAWVKARLAKLGQ